MDRFPQVLYRFPGTDAQLQDGMYGVLMVADEDQQAAALADGWHEKSDAARSAYEQPPLPEPSRADLEQKATELGLKFDGRTSDKKLRDLIAATLEV